MYFCTMQNEVTKALDIIKRGGTLLYPTDTIWGLGCDATNAQAVQKIYQIKERDPSKSLLVLVSDEGMLQRFVKEVPEVCWDLIDCATDPLTIIYPQANGLAPGVAASNGSIGIRLVQEGFAFELVRKLRKPLISTSANLSGEPSPSNYDEISDSLKERVDYIVNLPHASGRSKASSILKVALNGEIHIIRK